MCTPPTHIPRAQSRAGHRCRRLCAALPTALALLLGVALAPPQLALGQDAAYHTITLHGAITVLDGDTFEADLDGNGKVERPRERVRMLFVDTPELGESHKGQDLAHGIPAREALRAMMTGGPVRLRVPVRGGRGNYGRTLAVVLTGEQEANLALVAQGHSPVDTRFGLPPNLEAYLQAEAGAFAARRGIWADASSRSKYLKRLRQELRTPQTPANSLFASGTRQAATLDLAPLLDRYLTLEGTVDAVRPLSGGVVRVDLRGPAGRPLPVIFFRKQAQRDGARAWRPGARIQAAGFVKRYKGLLEVVAHHGKPAGK